MSAKWQMSRMEFQNGSAFQNGSSEWKCIPEWKFRVEVNSRVEYLVELNGPYGLPYYGSNKLINYMYMYRNSVRLLYFVH